MTLLKCLLNYTFAFFNSDWKRLKLANTNSFWNVKTFTGSFGSNVGASQHKHAKKLSSIQKKAFMIELIIICMGICNLHRLMNDHDSTWMSQVSGLRKELISSLASGLCVVGCGLLPESCSYTLFTGPAVCCVVVDSRVCTTLDTANQNCAEADSLLRLQVDSRVHVYYFSVDPN